MSWIKNLFKKKTSKKVIIRFRNGQMLPGDYIIIPSEIAHNHIKMGMFSQWLYSYQFHLGQHPSQNQIGGAVGSMSAEEEYKQAKLNYYCLGMMNTPTGQPEATESMLNYEKAAARYVNARNKLRELAEKSS